MKSPDQADRTLISVILLCYNHERFIGEALDGLFSQTYAPLEVVIIDDCSPDRTGGIIEARLKDRPKPNVRFVRNRHNISGAASIENGMRMLAGSFIVIVSGDDVMLPGFIEEMALTWRARGVSLVTTNAFYIDDHSKPLDRTFQPMDVLADDSFETLLRDGANACCFGAAMGFDREIYDTFGWPSTPLLGAHDIVLPFYAYLLRGACFLNWPLVNYRVHSGNASLSLAAEKSDREQELLVNDRIFNGHLAHAVFFQQELERLRNESPQRYGEIATRSLPLLTIQTVEMAKKLVRNRWELDALRRSR